MHAGKRTNGWAFLAVAAVLITAWWPALIISGGPDATQGAAAAAGGKETAARKQVTLYYFHGTLRCKTCRTIEAYAKEAIESRFAEPLRSGLLRWQVINIDEPENEHFVDELALVSSSLVVVSRSGDTMTNHETLQDAWTLVRDKARYMEYVQSAVATHLK